MRTIFVSFLLFLAFPVIWGISKPNYDKAYHRKLVLVGGGEVPEGAKTRFIEMAGGKDARLVIIPSASQRANQQSYTSMCMDSWKGRVASVEILHAQNKEEAMQFNFYSRIRNATGCWFSGGDQSNLIKLYFDTPVVDELRNLMYRGGVIGGTSAGASIVGKIMPFENSEMYGFGLLDNMIIDQHFNTRHREHRLNELVKNHPGMIGVGIDESTAVVVDDKDMTVIGVGTICLLP